MGKSQLRKYIGYAVSEVLLVIIGILIAVSLNNANERRKERAEINSLLRLVQAELNANIEQIDNLYLYYGDKDSLIYTFLNEAVPSKTMDDRFVGIFASMTMNYSSMEVQSDAYEALMKKAEYFPKDYSELIQKLKLIYGQDKKNIEKILTLINESISEKIDYLSNSQSWYTDFFYRSILSPDVKPFILSDIRFINKVSDYVNLSSGNLLPTTMNHKKRAVEAYRQIETLLPESSNRAEVKAAFDYDVADYQSWLGNYRDPADSDTLQMMEVEGKIRMIWRGNDLEVFPLNRQDFNIAYPFFLKMQYNGDGTVKELQGHYPNRRFVYEKLE